MAKMPDPDAAAPPTDRADDKSLQAAAPTEISLLDLSQRSAAYQIQLAAELSPQSALARVLVNVLGRHAAGMDLAAEAEAATVRFASQHPEAQALYLTAAQPDRPYLATMGSELVAAASRYQAKHERGFFRALRELREISRDGDIQTQQNVFADEESCLAYLAGWQQQQPWKCKSCGSSERYFLPSRAKFRCRCGLQSSPREGTAFAKSKVCLLSWFEIVFQLLADPQSTASALAKSVRVVRKGTLLKMRAIVRQALGSPSADIRLAGLPTYYLTYMRQVSLHPHKILRLKDSPEPGTERS